MAGEKTLKSKSRFFGFCQNSLAVFLLLVMISQTLYAATLNQVRSKVISANQTELTLYFSAPVSHKGLKLKKPPREVLDFPNSKAKKAFDVAKTNQVKRFRYARNRQGTLRLVVDLTSPTLEVKVDKVASNIIKINVFGKGGLASSSKSLSAIAKPRDVVVVLDPGHGGKDPGATGAKGTKEKDVVLKIAKVLQSEINSTPGMRAYLTRSTDDYLSLRKRLDIARQKEADLFISIHADAFVSKHSRGASVFALSAKGATSEAARWLAEKENYSELGGVDLGKLHDKSGVVRSVLIDLSQTATIRSSLLLGKMVLNKLDDLTVLHHDKVEQAQFVVLKSPDIPSILIETGFITNPKEEKNLNSRWYHKKLSKALVQGIESYFYRYSPRGSAFSERKTRMYRVKKGDTLLRIAQNESISLKTLLSYNGLKINSPIITGQRLKIPVT